MKEVFYRPSEVNQTQLIELIDTIKDDRTHEDILFQIIIEMGMDLNLPIRNEIILGKTVFFVNEKNIVACFDEGITDELAKELAYKSPHCAVFRDNAFISDAVKINVNHLFDQISPTTKLKII